VDISSVILKPSTVSKVPKENSLGLTTPSDCVT
jgi:hypothetical protein